MSAASAAIVPGLVTVTFRKLTPREIIDLARETNLTALEWGGDVHVPPGDVARAREVKQMTVDAGLEVLAYGSYYRLGGSDAAPFEIQLESTVAVGARAIRVWPGNVGSAAADADYRRRVVEDALRCAELCAKANVTLCYEFHEGTLTDTDDSAAELLAATQHPSIKTLWQPSHEQTVDSCCASLRRVLPRVHHVHVFHWPIRGTRSPLAEGADRWRAYFEILKREHPLPVLLEFVPNDEPDQFRRDAATLHQLIKS